MTEPKELRELLDKYFELLTTIQGSCGDVDIVEKDREKLLNQAEIEILALLPQTNKIPVEKYCECGQLEIGKSYKRADNKPFSFKKEIGIFIGMTTGQDKFPRFKLNEKGMECFLNYQPTLENFIECKPIKQSARVAEEEIKNIGIDLIDEYFPKGECKERGAAIVLYAQLIIKFIEYLKERE